MSSYRDMLQTAWEHQRTGHLDEADRIVRDVLSAEPDNTTALRLIAGVARKRGQHAPAIEYLRRAVQLAPHDLHAQFELGARASGRGQGRRSRGMLSKCLKRLTARRPIAK